METKPVEFEKKRTLTPEEMFKYINEYAQLKLGSATTGIPVNTQFIAEIIGELVVEQSPDEENTFYAFPVKYHCKGYDPEYVEFKVFVAGSKAEKLVSENPDYIGKKVLFGKGKFSGKVFNSLAILKQEQRQEFVIPKKIQEFNEEVSKGETGVPEHLKNFNFEIPEELKAWVEDAYEHPDDFMTAFPTIKPFLDYVLSESCDTKWFQEQKDSNASVAGVYYTIIKKIKG